MVQRLALLWRKAPQRALHPRHLGAFALHDHFAFAHSHGIARCDTEYRVETFLGRVELPIHSCVVITERLECLADFLLAARKRAPRLSGSHVAIVLLQQCEAGPCRVLELTAQAFNRYANLGRTSHQGRGERERREENEAPGYHRELMKAEACRFPMAIADVVYVHGLWLTGHESVLLRRRLERQFGFRVHAFRYPTVSATMEDITARLDAFVRKLEPVHLHFVGHSLGGLVIYRFLERYPQQPPGRVVFLGTPCATSRAAVNAARMRWAARLVGQCVTEELLVHRERRWGESRELGIIAGTRRVGLGQFLARFDEECDGTIAVSETQLAGASDHITLPVSHMGMLLSARVAMETGEFLDKGRFSLG